MAADSEQLNTDNELINNNKFPDYLKGPLLDKACHAFLSTFSTDENIVISPDFGTDLLLKKIYTKKLAHANNIILGALTHGLPRKHSKERMLTLNAMNAFAHMFAYKFIKKAERLITEKKRLISIENRTTAGYMEAHRYYEKLIVELKLLKPNSDERKAKRREMLISRIILDELREQSKQAKQDMHKYITYSDQLIKTTKLTIS